MTLTSKFCLGLSATVKRSALSFPKGHCSELHLWEGQAYGQVPSLPKEAEAEGRDESLGLQCCGMPGAQPEGLAQDHVHSSAPTRRLWSHGSGLS